MEVSLLRARNRDNESAVNPVGQGKLTVRTEDKGELMEVVTVFSSMHPKKIHWLNSTNVALLPKKEGAVSITNFWSINLIHEKGGC